MHSIEPVSSSRANCISPFLPNLLNSTSPITVTSISGEFLDFLSLHASDIRDGRVGNDPESMIIFLIFANLSVKQDCMSVRRPSVTEFPVMSKWISISGSISLAFIGKSPME